MKISDARKSLFGTGSNSKTTSKTDSGKLTVSKAREMLFTSKPTIDFSQYDPDILDTLKQDSSAWTYDLFDAEDLQRKSMGIMPKSVESSYDLDDPIDKYLYEQGYVSRNKFSKGYQQAEKDNAAKANFSTEVQKNAAQKPAQYREEDPSYSEKEAYEKAFEELRKTDAYKNLIKSDDLESYFKNYVKDSMQNKLTEQSEDEVLQAMMDRTIGTGRTLSSVSLPQAKTDTGRQKEAAMRLASNMAGKDFSEKEITAPIIPGTKAWETMMTETVDDITQSNAEEKARIRRDAVFYNGHESEARKKEIDKRIKEINRVLNRGQGVQQTYIDPDKRNSQLQERNALQAELSTLQAERDTIVAGRNAEKLVDFFKIPEQNADFAQYSEYDPAKAKTEGVLYSFINGENPAETSVLMPMGINAPSSTSDPDYAFAYMNGEERSIYNYLVNTDKNSDEYLEALRPYLNQRMRAAVEREASEYAAEKPVLSSLETIVTSPVSAIEGLIGLGKTGYNAITGQDTDPNDPVFQNTRRSAAIRNTVSNTIRTENQGFVGEALAMLYQTGMSMGDTAVRLPMGAAGLGVAGLSAAASAMDDALSRGASSGQALASGLMTGAAEVVFEKASLDNLVSMSRAGNSQQVVKNILKQGGVEASEEVFTEIANTISDAVIMADKSAYEIAVRDYMANGMTEQAARQLASMDSFKAILDAGVGGFISGGAFGTGGQMMALGQTALTGRAIERQGLTEDVISEGMAFPAGNEARTQAEQTLQKPNVLNVGRQFYANQDANAQHARDTFQKEVTEATGSADHADIAMKLYDRMVEGKAPQQIVKEFSKIQDSIRATTAKKAEINAELENEELKIKTKLETSYGKMVSAMEAGDINAFNTARQAYINEYKISAYAARLARMKTENRIAEETAKVQKTIESAEFTFEKLEEIPQWEATRNAENATAYADMMQALEAGNQEEFRRLEEIYNNTRNATEIADRTLAQNADVIYDQIMTAMEENDSELRDRAQNLYERAERASKAGKGKGEKVKAEAVTNVTAEQKPKTEKKAQPPKRTNDAKTRDAGKQALRKLEPSAKEELFKKFGKNADTIAAEMLQRYYAEVDGQVADDIPDNVKERFFEAFENAETGFIETDEGEVLYQSEAIEDNAPEEKPGPGLKREYDYAELTEVERETIRNSDRELSILDSVAKAGGIEITLVRTIKGLNIAGHTMQSEPNGIYDRVNGKIYIALDAQGGAISYIAFHELTHYIKQHAKRSYGVLEKTVFNALGDAKVRQLVSEQMRQHGYSADVAREEVLANAIPAILTDEQYVKQLIKRDPNLAGQIKKIIDAILDALTAQFVDLTAINPDFAPAADLEHSIETLRKMQKFFDAGLAEAAGNHKPQSPLQESRESRRYDDAGKAIPLSERFNAENDDIRFSDRAEESASNQISQAAKIRAEAERLYNEGVTIQQYYAQNKDNYSVRVGRMLMALWLKNGTDVGGKIADNKMNVIMQNRNHFDFKGILGTGVGKNIKLNLMSPLRVFEDLASWRKGKDSESRAMNYLEGEAFKEMFFDPVLQAGAQANMFMEREAEKIKTKLEAIPKQDRQMASCLVQLVGEGLVTESEASFARFGKAGMLVRAKTGNYVFNKDGQLAAIESTDEETGATTLAIFDDSFYRRIREANKDIEKILGSRNALMSNTEKNRKVQEIKQRARQNRPIILDGQRLIINEGKDRINIQTTSGREILNLQDAKSPEIKKVTALVDVLRDFYDRVHAEQSRVLVEAGYNPVRKQKAYFPHQGRESVGIMDAISTIVMGEAEKIPTEIIGKTGQFKPGKPFVNHLLARLGDKTEYDAIRGFNRYLRSAADLMYYTPAIQRLRQLENFLRAESQGTQNNAIVAWLQEYTNSIANKKHSMDRGGEALIGREAYTVTDKLTGLFGAASVSGNLSTALSNNISLLTAVPGLEKKYIAKAAKDSWNNAWREVIRGGQGDDFAKKIPFLARRFGGYEALLTNEIKMAGRKVNNAMGAMFAFTDQFAVETAARAKYAELMAKGDPEAVRKTNEFLLKNFADRSKGMMPTIYNMRLLRLLTQFQLEGHNQLSHFGDMSRATIGRQVEKQLTPEQIRTLMNGQLAEIDWSKVKIKSHDPREIASKLLYLALLSLWGLFTRWAMGQDQTWNPAGMTADFAKAAGEGDLKGAFSKLGQDVFDQVPFIQTLTGGGRIPAFGGIQNVADAVAAVFDKDSTGDLAKITQGAAAFVPGGAQISKTIRGIDAYARGGSYSGKGNLRYPVEQNAGNLVKSVLFGPASNQPQGYDYLTDTLTEKKTGAYKELIEAGVKPTEAYDALREYGGDTNAAKLTSLAEAEVDEKTRKLIAKAMGLTLGEGTIKSQAKAEAEEYLADKEKQYKSGKITKADLEAADKKTQDLIKRLLDIK